MIFGHIHKSNYNPNPRVKGSLRFCRVFPSVNNSINYAPAILQQFCEKAIKKYNQENEEEEGNTYIFAELEEAFVRSSHIRDNIVIYFKACQRDGTTTTFRANTYSASKRISHPRIIPFGPDPDIDINVTPWSSTDKPESPTALQRNCGGPRLVA